MRERIDKGKQTKLPYSMHQNYIDRQVKRSPMKSHALIVIALLAVTGFVAGCGRPALPPIMEERGVKATLVERVSALHPVGSSSQDLADELKRQGFEVRPGPWFDLKLRRSNGHSYQAHKKLYGNIFPCVAIIDWRPDVNDNIVAYENVMVGCAGP
jgi:hypothetical protein